MRLHEIAFELRINRARYIRIYADVLLITEDKVFSLEFKMKNKIEEEEIQQAAKYVEYLDKNAPEGDFGRVVFHFLHPRYGLK